MNKGKGYPLLKMVNISKSFGNVRALRNVSMNVNYNEILGVVGDNGAGKSTLIKVLLGVHKPDTGEIYFEGKKVKINSPQEARALGIEPVYQDLALIDLINVWRNFFLTREYVKMRYFLDKEKNIKECKQALKKTGMEDIDVTRYVKLLSGGQRQAVAISRALYYRSKLLVLDEPVSALSVRESEKVLELVMAAKKEGVSSIIISHNIYQIYPVVDRFLVLDRGVKIGEFDKKDVSPEDIINLIRVGRREE